MRSILITNFIDESIQATVKKDAQIYNTITKRNIHTPVTK